MTQRKGTAHSKKTTGGKKTSHTKTVRKTCREKLEQAEKTIAELKDQQLRLLAELDNVRKRSEREMGKIVLHANTELIRAVLPVIDDMERSLKSADKKNAEFFRGVELIHQKLLQILQSFGLQVMETTGKPFDVDRHDALMQVNEEGIPSGHVVSEHEKGYLLHDQVIRHAKVIVNK
ncbi:MAG TPA: nucleotide exchange factor GrpE [bacterium]|nr:nucleotide exchange factor GrpE [bacterium]